ncbi:hypothetical protein D3C87_1455060 [compost metagenome]
MLWIMPTIFPMALECRVNWSISSDDWVTSWAICCISRIERSMVAMPKAVICSAFWVVSCACAAFSAMCVMLADICSAAAAMEEAAPFCSAACFRPCSDEMLRFRVEDSICCEASRTLPIMLARLRRMASTDCMTPVDVA